MGTWTPNSVARHTLGGSLASYQPMPSPPTSARTPERYGRLRVRWSSVELAWTRGVRVDSANARRTANKVVLEFIGSPVASRPGGQPSNETQDKVAPRIFGTSPNRGFHRAVSPSRHALDPTDCVVRRDADKTCGILHHNGP